MADVAATARSVHAAWASPLQAMKNNPHDGASAAFGGYIDSWRALVQAAPAQLVAYDKAVNALKRAPACPA